MDFYLQETTARLIQQKRLGVWRLRWANFMAKRSGQRLIVYLLESGHLPKDVFLQTLSEVSGLPCRDLAAPVAVSEARALPYELAESLNVLVVDRQNARYQVVMSDPTDVHALGRLRQLLGEVEPMVTYTPDLEGARERAYGLRPGYSLAG